MQVCEKLCSKATPPLPFGIGYYTRNVHVLNVIETLLPPRMFRARIVLTYHIYNTYHRDKYNIPMCSWYIPTCYIKNSSAVAATVDRHHLSMYSMLRLRSLLKRTYSLLWCYGVGEFCFGSCALVDRMNTKHTSSH